MNASVLQPRAPTARGGATTTASRRASVACAVEPIGRTALVTGANTGIGFETSMALASQGYQTVLAGRNEEKVKAACEKIRTRFPDAKVESAIFDLSDQASIKDWANRALDMGHPLDVLVNNAGVMATPEMKTKDGYEYQIGINHFGHYTLTNMLLPLIAGPDRDSRIVNVSSSAHLFGTMAFDDLFYEQSEYQPWIAYGQSKLANAVFTYELARKLGNTNGTTVNALHPGVVATELQRYLIPDPIPEWQKPLMKVMEGFLLTPQQGAATSIYLATSPEVQGITAKYFDDCKPKTGNVESYRRDVQAKLWERSAELTGVDFTVSAVKEAVSA